ncbi:MAG TPA: hypothetical protein VIY68_15160 [Steroidobacteraceae bacterium]
MHLKTMMTELIEYLRQVALTCTRLAHNCPHKPTAHALEGVAVDLMGKARELENPDAEGRP